MSAARTVVLAAGVATALAGLALVTSPGLVAGVGIAGLLLGGVAAVALTLAAVALASRYRADGSTADPPAPGIEQSFPAPGERFDERLAAADGRDRAAARTRRQLREEVGQTATEALTRRDGVDPGAARDRLEDGTWTDDPVAASYFTRDTWEAAVEDAPLLARLGLAVSAGRRRAHAAGRAAEAVVDVVATTTGTGAGVAGDSPEDADGGDPDASEPGAGTLGRLRGAVRANGGADAGAGTGTARESLPARGRVVRETARWRGITAMAFVAAGAGVAWTSPPLLLAAVVPIAYAAYARSARAPSVDLSVERSLDDDDPDPGETVTVETTVRNGGSTLADLRLYDGVPPGLAVADGAARCAAALPPGGEVTLTYDVTAEPGTHEWGPLVVVARDASGARELETAVDGPATTLTCVPELSPAEAVPLRPLTVQRTGRVHSEEAGPGVAFHSLREYRHGDPPARVAWDHLARTGDLATREFDAERMARVVLLFDVRAAAYVAADGTPSAVEHALTAGRQLLAGLLDAGNEVGVAGLGPENCWLAPGLGRDHRARAKEFLATAEPFATTPPEGSFYPTQLDELRKRLRGELQVVWLSPLADDYAAEVARKLESAGHAVTVVSPDVTGDRTTGQRFAGAQRRLRLAELREAGVRVVDWRPPEPFAAATARAERGWGR